MENILTSLSELFYNAIIEAYPQLNQSSYALTGDIAQSRQENFGHYQCNAPLRLAKIVSQPPRQVAEGILAQINMMLSKDLNKDRWINSLEIAGPGFINIYLAPSFLSSRLNTVLRGKRLGINLPAKPERIIVDFSSPNTAKEMHVGHLRSTIIGDCLARLFEFLGHDVIRLNHVGDWGTAFGMLIAYMKQYAPEVLSGKVTANLNHLVTWYKAAKKLFDEDPLFKNLARLEVVKLQGCDPQSLQSWITICDISRRAYQEIYDLLDIKIIERGESFYNDMLANIVSDLESKGLVTVSNGAKCIFLEDFKGREGEPLPLMVQKSDGGYTYDTTDLAAIRYRIEVEHVNRIIYVTDVGQGLHFKMIFKAAEKAGYLNPDKTQVDHVGFGLVLGPDGKKFKTRSGETERLIDLLTSAVNHASQILKEKNPQIPEQERSQIAYALGIGAVKYADLSTNRTGDYTFSYEKMLKFEGNTAAFLMYTYVRAESIKRRIRADISEIINNHNIKLIHSSEVALGLHILQFSEALDQVSRDLMPNRLTDYLYGLAEKFNAFFRDCRVEGAAEQDSRLLLCDVFARTMKQGLKILGIKTVERM